MSVAVMSSGCGNGVTDGPPIYPISGTVTYQQQPVPCGTVTLEPDAARGGTGPSLTFEIHNGNYASEHGKGTRGGAYLVQISGTDGQPVTLPDGMVIPEGKPLFPLYQTGIELPARKAVQNFDVLPNPVKK